MRLLFLAIIIHLFSINLGYAMDDEGIMNRRGTHRRFHIQQDAAQQVIEPENEEGFSLTRIISSGFNKIKPTLPIIAYFIFRFLQECPGDCAIE